MSRLQNKTVRLVKINYHMTKQVAAYYFYIIKKLPAE